MPNLAISHVRKSSAQTVSIGHDKARTEDIFGLTIHRGWRKAALRHPTLSAWPFVVVILMQMAVGGFSVFTLSATRVLVAGESLWSKGEHEAIYYLDLYLDTGSPLYLSQFQRAIAVPLAYREGREALERTPPQFSIARRAFERGGSAPEDISSGIWMLVNFRASFYLEDAVSKWKQSDRWISELDQLGRKAAAEHPVQDRAELRRHLEGIDDAITPRANAFARALSDAARVVERSLLITNFALAALLAALTIWRVGKVIRQKRRYESALAWQASHDDLTGVSNRRAFEERLARAVAASKRSNSAPCALLYIDLDQFKVVNDTCGHAAGDALLRRICTPLQALLTAEDTFARLGGDEFSILATSADKARATALAEDARAAVGRFDFYWNGRKFSVTASIGLVHSDATIASPEDMLMKADMACFMAKEKGRNRVHLHRDEDQDLLSRMREMNWVQRVQAALDENRFSLYAQDIVPLAAGDDDGVHLEILIRMHDEDGVLVPPSSFIPAAERFGLMKLIDRWVVTRTFQILAERREVENTRPISCCAINLSGATIGDDAFLDFLKQTFAKFKIAPHVICFEVTETTAIVNLDAARAFVCDLRALGCTFALDDFGSGMSSFNYLKELPVDYLKIDGAFVRNLLTDRPDRAMVEMISHVGHIMGKRIVAEFVETEEIADALRDIGVDYGQGYGIAPPKAFHARFEGVAARLQAPKQYQRKTA